MSVQRGTGPRRVTTTPTPEGESFLSESNMSPESMQRLNHENPKLQGANNVDTFAKLNSTMKENVGLLNKWQLSSDADRIDKLVAQMNLAIWCLGRLVAFGAEQESENSAKVPFDNGRVE